MNTYFSLSFPCNTTSNGNESQKVYLTKNCHYVTGAINAAIYDLNNCKVYAINDEGRKIIDSAFQSGSISTLKEAEYIQALIQADLMTYDEQDYEPVRVPSPALNYAWLELTEACNLRCIHCYGQWGYPEKAARRSVAQWKDTLTKLHHHGCRQIQLIGGEPLTHSGFLEILDYAKAIGMSTIDVFTNGTLINAETIQHLKQANAAVRVSVYGHTSDTHDKITNVSGSFEKTMAALQLLKEAEIPTTIAVILMRENQNLFPEIQKHIESQGFRCNKYDTIRKTCGGSQQCHQITNIDVLKSRYQTEPDFDISPKTFENNMNWNSCWFGKIAITATGDIIPCIFARENLLGNIDTDSEADLQKNIIKAWGITKDDVLGCKNCEFRYSCHDCRPLANGLLNDPLGKYPRCCYDPLTGTWKPIEEVTLELGNE